MAGIRRTEASDLPALEWDGRFSDHRQLIAEAFGRQQRGEVLMLLAESAGAVLGQIWIDLTRKRAEGIGVLWALRVRPAFRGNGLGRRLMRRAERELRARGYTWAELEVEPQNERAARLYRRLGYQPAGRDAVVVNYQTPEGEPRTMSLNLVLLRRRLAESEEPR